MERLRQLGSEYPDHPKARAAADRTEYLEAEARRGADWLADPVASLREEIEERAEERSAHGVYKSVVTWLQRRGDRSSQLAVSRWACTQTDWPISAQLACHHDLVDALLDEESSEAERLEAAEVLGEVVDLAGDDDWAVPAALRRSRVLSELGRFQEADQTLDEIEDRISGSLAWGPQVLGERIRSLLDRGDRDRARAFYEELSSAYPDHGLTEELRPIFSGTGKEESR